ncbi:Glycosyltransferase involved in cell wall bisynthesis [Halovenus aranensis]|uniref:Glycosyltransferase involved in cell wall bisynthesis n=1 Tax=Halovenus aranensis TaxID=890420 RepID=A0A1G8S2I4_9EURY|nr:glycosyltransferase family 4 protein [Halovenus aranensis]SDJ23447.1 Glycosyltransferase involved in cell wall bisynthesis [Halovenus aranensis]
MRVSHYFEWESQITGGHAQSVQNQRTVLDRKGIEYTTEPTLDADVLHLNNMGPRSVYYAKRAQRADVPVVVHGHQTAEDLKESFRFFTALSKPARPYLSYAYSLADHIVCPTEHNRRVLETYTDAPKTVISNGFDPGKIDGHDDDALRQEYLDRYDLDPPVVFMVGHVIERKGLRSFVETARRMPDVDFAWFGYLNPGGGTVDRLLRSRTTTKLVNAAPENCTFTGYVDDIAGAFAAGDVFFWPSKNENEGMALLEAMAAGKPPVIRDIETYGWLDDETHCLKADEEFVDPLRRLVENPTERDRFGDVAAEKSAEFTIDAIADDIETLYGRITA